MIFSFLNKHASLNFCNHKVWAVVLVVSNGLENIVMGRPPIMFENYESVKIDDRTFAATCAWPIKIAWFAMGPLSYVSWAKSKALSTTSYITLGYLDDFCSNSKSSVWIFIQFFRALNKCFFVNWNVFDQCACQKWMLYYFYFSQKNAKNTLVAELCKFLLVRHLSFQSDCKLKWRHTLHGLRIIDRIFFCTVEPFKKDLKRNFCYWHGIKKICNSRLFSLHRPILWAWP